MYCPNENETNEESMSVCPKCKEQLLNLITIFKDMEILTVKQAEKILDKLNNKGEI